MILADHQISEYYKAGDIVIEPFDQDYVQPASYDLRVGAEAVLTSGTGVIDVESSGFIKLKPGDFGIFISHEIIKLGPQFCARFGLRSSYARKGLIATTGPQIDPGFHGRLIVGVTNLTPHEVSIAHLDKFLTVEFHRLEKAVLRPYSGKYQKRMNLTAEEFQIVAEKSGVPLVKVMESVEHIKRDVHALTTSNKYIAWTIGIGFAAMAAVLAVMALLLAKAT
jgi:dCTP deaminase